MSSLLEMLAADGLIDGGSEGGGEAERRSVVLVGVTGDGKSSTGNTLTGAATFAVSDGFASATQSCSHTDYIHEGQRYRVVDTIGLQDTGLSAAEVMRRFSAFAEHTPDGIDAFLFVVRWGRWKPEHEATIDAFVANCGEQALRRTILVLTHCTDSRALASALEQAPAQLKGWLGRVHSAVGVDNSGSGATAGVRQELHAAIESLCHSLGRHSTGGIAGGETVRYSNSALAEARAQLDVREEDERAAFSAAVADWRKAGSGPVQVVREEGVITRAPACVELPELEEPDPAAMQAPAPAAMQAGGNREARFASLLGTPPEVAERLRAWKALHRSNAIVD